MLFNINDNVQVQLTERGSDIFGSHLVSINPTTLDGWTTFQMWDLMRIFGPHMHMGTITPFKTNIRILEQ
jgi:hypothetical protein